MSTLKFTCSLLLLQFCTLGYAQQQKEAEEIPDPPKSGLKVGVDLARFAYQIMDPKVRGVELLSQYELMSDVFLSVEGGYEVARPDFENYEYNLSGGFARIGFDYDLLANRDDFDMVFIGLRYGFSFYQQEAAGIDVESYWGNQEINLEPENLRAQWLEAVLGINAELFFARNIYIGWMIRGKFITKGNEYEIITPYRIPGLAGEEKNFALGASWSLMYRIPLKPVLD